MYFLECYATHLSSAVTFCNSHLFSVTFMNFFTNAIHHIGKNRWLLTEFLKHV